ncbi:MAG: hypothetical protein ACI4KG_00355 [Oscillospiraceae bacterium]
MKITCGYCGSKFNDTLESCPNCGAPNEGVIRTSGGQPVTIEQLKDWYSSKGLPPYEITRFFIGENYKKPKAFGIYKDEKTGNFVVYKNKASGERAVRYEGTDEAYAVNELFQRLKQEIIEQKALNVKKNAVNVSEADGTKENGFVYVLKKIFKPSFWKIFALFAVIFIGYFGFIEPATIPIEGYYICDGNVYYHASSDLRDYWYLYDSASGEWTKAEMYNSYPDVYNHRKTANEYLESEAWSASIPCSDFKQSIAYSDYINHYEVNKGYYSYNDNIYYHLYDDYDSGWYSYNYYYSLWEPADFDSVPDELTHNSVAEDFYFTPVWDSTTQFSDFEDTSYYSDYISEQNSRDSWDNDDDSDYDWDSNDSWDDGGMDWDSDW